VGTLTEVTLTWSLLQTGQISPRPLILVGDSWRHLLEAFRAETFVSERDLALVTLVDDVDQALAFLKEALGPIP
jgi:predicted Rossmann-fold nucleotide-binding protein